jgi:predicted HTH transcriptional regulator
VEVGGRPPSFEMVADEFTVTLYAVSVANAGPPKTAPTENDSVPGASSATVPFPGNDRQREIVRIIETKGWVSSGVVVQKLGIVKDTAVRDLNDLTERGLVMKSGTGRATRYHATEAAKQYFSTESRPNSGRKSDDSRT